MRSAEGIIQCDKCGCSAGTDSEVLARENGWVVAERASPPRHFCPACRQIASPG